MFSKRSLFSPLFIWDPELSTRDNVYNVIRDYLPYQFNVLTQKTHLADAREMIDHLETHPNATDCEIYLLMQAMRQELNNEGGEYKKRLTFCVQKMEEQNVLLKTLGSAGQAYKSIFGEP